MAAQRSRTPPQSPPSVARDQTLPSYGDASGGVDSCASASAGNQAARSMYASRSIARDTPRDCRMSTIARDGFTID